MQKQVGIGKQDFAALESQCFYIDKTDFMRQWWNYRDDVTLITRPRRFGKTLNMSMLNCFFSNKYADRGDLFEGIDIWKDSGYRQIQGTYPVLYLSFASVKADNVSDAKKQVKSRIVSLYQDFEYLLENEKLMESEKMAYRHILTEMAEMDDVTACDSLNYLCRYLEHAYGKKVIILLDEYDIETEKSKIVMIKFLNDIRNVEKPISNNRKIINTIAVLFLGIALGTFSKFLDFRQAELPSGLMAIDAALDVHNFLGRFAIWVLIALCISIYSNSAIRASVNVFAFFIGMVASYYLYSNYIAGFFPRSYAVIWFGFTAVSPLLSFACWYARGKSKLALILSALILAVLFNMCFVYGCWYFNAKSVLEVIVFIIGLIVLRRDTLKSSALMGTISIVLAVLLDMVIPLETVLQLI